MRCRGCKTQIPSGLDRCPRCGGRLDHAVNELGTDGHSTARSRRRRGDAGFDAQITRGVGLTFVEDLRGPRGGAVTEYVVSKHGDAQFTTLADAIRNAEPGSRILIRPGIYREALVIDAPVDLVADGPAGSVVIEAAGTDAIRLRAPSACLRGLTLRVSGADEAAAIHVSQGRPAIEDCDIAAGAGVCVSVHGDATQPILRRCRIHDGSVGVLFCARAQGVVEECEIFGQELAGVAVTEESVVTVRGCHVHDNPGGGVYFHSQSGGLVEACDIASNAGTGIAVKEDSAPTIRRCRIHDGNAFGVVFYQRAIGLMEKCEVFANQDAGIEIREEANPCIADSRIYEGRHLGVYVHHNGMGVIEDCDIFRHKRANVAVSDHGAPVFRRCTLRESKAGGAFIFSEARAEFEDCEIFKNTLEGLRVGESSSAIVRDSRIHTGKAAGVLIYKHGAATLDDCTIRAHPKSGIVIMEEAEAVARRCTIRENTGAAVRIDATSRAKVIGCDLSGNTAGSWLAEPGGEFQMMNDE